MGLHLDARGFYVIYVLSFKFKEKFKLIFKYENEVSIPYKIDIIFKFFLRLS